MKEAISKTLKARGARYGDFTTQAHVSQNIKRAMADSKNWAVLPDNQREALEMIAVKISRILHADNNYHDSWHDIIGYAKLVEDTLEPV